MKISDIKKELLKNADEKYKKFQKPLIPSISEKNMIGVRTPVLKKLAKNIKKEIKTDDIYNDFLNKLPHKYFEENQLHAFFISEINDFNECIKEINKFLPYIDNWATCDQLNPKIFKKYKIELLKEIDKWVKSKHIYTVRFGIKMLMSHFLDEEFDKKYLDIVSKIKSNEYYVNMMRSWYFATALAKKYNETIKYIENKKLDSFTHNHTIKKALESFRVSDTHKKYLKSLKME